MKTHPAIAIAAVASVCAVLVSVGVYLVATSFTGDGVERTAAVSATESGGGASFAFSFSDQPRPVSLLRFTDRDGHALSLADFRGRPVS